MFRLVSEGWDKEVINARQANPDGLRVVCPFIKEAALSRILDVGAGQVEVVTRFDLNCYYEGVSDLDALGVLLAADAKVRGIKGLHSKLYLFGATSAIATSANVTDAGMLRNHEFGFVSDDRDVVVACQTYFDQLWRRAGENLTARQLEEWRQLVAAARRKGGGGARPRLPDHGARGGNGPLAVPASREVTYANQAFLKFLGTSDQRSPRDLGIADMVAESGCALACTYPTNQRPRQIEDGDVLYMARIAAAPEDFLIFGYATGWRHRDEEDVATADEITVRPWKARYKNYIRVHDAHFVDAQLGVGVSMAEMLRALGSDAWRSTQDNVRHGHGNIDPFASYLRKPGMQLTDISRRWIHARLERLLQVHGEVDLTKRRFRAAVTRSP